jgi:hypothetical protein
MTKFEHPFAKVYRAVLKEKYPDKASAISDDSPIDPGNMPEDVVVEALKRYFPNNEPVLYTPFLVRSDNPAQKQEIKRTITYI